MSDIDEPLIGTEDAEVEPVDMRAEMGMNQDDPPSDQNAGSSSNENRGEMLSFLALVIVLIGVMGGVYLFGGMVFDMVVPAILGPIPPELLEETADPAAEDDMMAEDADGAMADDAGEDDMSGEMAEETDGEAGTDGDSAGDADADSSPDGDGAEPADDAGEAIIHTVTYGDTLYDIANKYGTTVEDLLEANELDNSSVIIVGQELTIP